MIYYCPRDREVCNCACCLRTGCMNDKPQRPVMVRCPSCDELVPANEYLVTRCAECAHLADAEVAL